MPVPQPHTLEAVEQDVERMKQQPVTIGLLVAVIGGAAFVVTNTIVIYAWVIGVGNTANAANMTTDRKVDALSAQVAANSASVQSQLDNAKAQRDLSMRNRDLQLDALKTEQDRQSKRQDVFETITADLSRKTERILVVVESLNDWKNKQGPAGR